MRWKPHSAENSTLVTPFLFLFDSDFSASKFHQGESASVVIALCRGMQASKTENRGKAGPFYWLSAAKPKTSSEIVNEARDALVNEARDALRTVKTRRPFTPTDEQRKLLGSQSSLCPQNRPPSVFSLDTFSSDSSESRPHSGVRLSPLAHKPVLVISEKKHEVASVFLPTPPADAAEVRKVSSAWKGLFRITSPKDLFSAKVVPLDQNDVKLNFEEPAMMVNDLDRSNNNCLAEQKLYTSFNDESRQVICNEHTSRSGSGESMEGTPVKFSLQLQGERSVNSDGRFADEEQQFPCNQMKEPGKMSSQPRTSRWKRRVTGLKDETRINGWEEEDLFWHTKILPILRELEKKDNIEHLCLACTKLYQTLDEGNMLGKRFKRRNVLLKTLYKLVDIDSDPLSLKLAKIILADLVIRVIFILGNLTAKNDQSREQFFKEKESVNILTSVFQTYYDLDLNAPTGHRDRKGKNHLKHPSEAEDVLIKLIRVLANLSIHPKVGAALAAAHPVVGLLVGVLEYKSVDACEELVINAATAINNLSYYQVKNSAVQDKKLHIAEMLLKLLMSDNMDAVLEAVRVFGNLSQHHEIRDFIMQKKIYKFMIALLDSKNREVCFPACGVLLNLTVDEDKRAFLMEEGGIGKLVDCLQDFGPADWQLSCLICKTLWNYSESMRSAASCFRGDTNTLLVLLTALLDEEVELECSLDRDIKDCQRVYWEREFKPVAEKLLDRIQSHHSSAESITPF
uniref:Armadillo repeat containing 2 n=1 Tax=Cyanistes caeruleus TaxID=156563 RepID=A0A8C0URS2_CYACU